MKQNVSEYEFRNENLSLDIFRLYQNKLVPLTSSELKEKFGILPTNK